MTVKEYQDKLIKLIEDATQRFNQAIPGIEREALNRILVLTKEIDVKNGQLINSTGNLKRIGQIRTELEGAIFNSKFERALQDFVNAFTAVADIHAKWFSAQDQRPPADILKELQNQAKTAVIEKLTKEIDVRIIPAVEEMLRTNITTGGTYQRLLAQVQDFIIGSGEIPGSFGKLNNLAATITTDALNSFSAQYSATITEKFNLDWSMYVGSNLTTTRPWCEAMTKKKYIHKAELPDILKGKIDDTEVKLNDKTGLWDGAKEGTDAQNIQVNRGGWKCGHQFLCVPEAAVPVDIRIRTYNKYRIPHTNGVAK